MLVVRVWEDMCEGKVIVVVFRYIFGGKMLILYLVRIYFIVDEDGKVWVVKEFDFEIWGMYVLIVWEEGFMLMGLIVNDIDLELFVVDVNDNNFRFGMR